MDTNSKFTSQITSSLFAMLAVVLLLAAGARPAVGQAACTGQTWTGTTPTVWAAEGSIKVMLNNTPTTNVPTIPTYLDDGNFNPAGYTAGTTTHPPITALNPVYSCPSGAPTITLAGAGRETISFQVFITAGVGASAALSNVTVEVTPLSPVSGSGTTPLTSDNTQTSDVTRYLEGYIPYTAGSPATLQVSGSFGCMSNPNAPPAFISCVPDPLIPFYSQYDSGNPPVANTFNVQPGTTQGVWVNVSIPVISASQPAGTYTGTVTVMEGGSTLATIPLTLSVWNGTLPRFDSPNRPDMLKAWMPLWPSEFVGEENLSCPGNTGPGCSADQAMMWKYQIMAHAYDFDTFEDGYTPLNGSTASYPSTSPTSFTTSAPNGPNGTDGTAPSTINWTAWDAYYGPAFTLGGPSAGGLFADGTAMRVFDSPAGTGGNCPWAWSGYSWSCGTNTLPPTGLLQLYTNFSEQISQHFSSNQANKGWGQPELLAYTFDEPAFKGTPAALGYGITNVYGMIAQFNQALNSANTALSSTWAASTNPVRSFLTDQVACMTWNDTANSSSSPDAYNAPQCEDHVNLLYPGGVNGGGVTASPDPYANGGSGGPYTNSWMMDWSPNPSVYMPGAAVVGSQALDLLYYCGVTALTAGTNYAYTLDMNPADKGVPTQSSAPAPIEKWFYQSDEPFDVADGVWNSGVGQRANFWIAYKYGLDETVPSVGDPNPAPSPGGIWDWAAEIWNSGQPYTNSGSWYFYPGNQLSAYNATGAVGNSILPQSLVHNGGGGITGPVASIRMEQWRRGYEDYMYLYSYGHQGCTTAPAQCNRAAAKAVVDSMGGGGMTSGGSGTTSWNALVWQNVDPGFLSGVWPMSTSGVGGSLNVPATCTDSTSGAGGLSNGLPNGPTGADFYYGSGCPGEWTNNPDRYAAARVTLATDLGWVPSGTPQAATPTFSPAAGSYSSAQSVTISDATSGAVIYYTTNGSTPTTSSSVYSGPITVSATETVEAIATATGYTTSATGSAAYTINSGTAATPTFNPAAGTYTSAQSVTISDSTSGAKIYYTTNGTTPTTSSTVYSGPITVSSTETVEAIATATGYTTSATGSAAYTINIPTPAATPTFSPAAGTYTSAQTVTISDATSGAKIYYTTNGTTPTTSSTLYSGAITVSATETVEAIATATGYTTSATGSAAYTINIPTPAATPTFNPAAGTTSSSALSVTISDTTSGAKIYYTTNGTTPTTSSTAYSGPITVSATETVEAIATATGYTTSAVGSAAYTINIPAPVATPTTIALTASPTSATAGSSVTLTATVSSSAGTPTGTVDFYNGSALLGSGVMNSSGVAIFSTSNLPAGTYNFTASYVANSSYATSTSAVASVTVSAGASPDYTLTANSTSMSIAPGQAGTTTLTVTPVGGYSGTLILTCATLPINSSCTFTQSGVTNNSVTLIGNNQPVNITLTIQTNVARMQAMPRPFGSQQSPLSPILPALAFWWPGSMAGLAAFGRKKNLSKTRQRMLQLCLLVLMTGALAAGISGCAGGSLSTAAASTSITPAGTSNVTITATPVLGTNGTPQTATIALTIT